MTPQYQGPFPLPQAWKDVIRFWFEECQESDWFTKNLDFDKKVTERFLGLHTMVANGELEVWRANPLGALAEVIVLDQFSRNIFRNTPGSFAYDGLALALTQRALELGLADQLNQKERWFLLMPYMHSESAKIHEQAMVLFKELGIAHVLDFEIAHKKIIDRFGRYPHRNEILGRESTAEEIEFLKEAGSSF